MDSTLKDDSYNPPHHEAGPSIKRTLKRLRKSRFRSSFALNKKDKEYIAERGIKTIQQHAYQFVHDRLKCWPAHDGRQTPWRGHPVFVAQHATATCCRTCMHKWHGIPLHKELKQPEIDFIVELLIGWINASR